MKFKIRFLSRKRQVLRILSFVVAFSAITAVISLFPGNARYVSARSYDPSALPADLQGPLGPIVPVLARLDPLLQTPIALSDEEFADLVDFVKYGLLYPRILPNHLKTLVPERVPSGSQTLTFEFQKAH